MKKKNYSLLIFVFLLSILAITSCKKDEKVKLAEENSKIIPSDPIASVSIDKNGIATIKTKLGKEIKQNVLPKTSKKDVFLSKLGVLNDTTTSKLPNTRTFRIPIRVDKSGSISSSFSSLSSSEASVTAPDGYFTFTLTRYFSYVNISVWPAVMPIDDYVVRATPIVTSHGNPVLWEINYVYTRNGSAFYSTQVFMSTYL